MFSLGLTLLLSNDQSSRTSDFALLVYYYECCISHINMSHIDLRSWWFKQRALPPAGSFILEKDCFQPLWLVTQYPLSHASLKCVYFETKLVLFEMMMTTGDWKKCFVLQSPGRVILLWETMMHRNNSFPREQLLCQRPCSLPLSLISIRPKHDNKIKVIC